MDRLIRLMKENGIKSVKLPQSCGKIILNGEQLDYDYKRAFRYYTEKRYAYNAAIEEINKDIERIREYYANREKVYVTKLIHHDYDGHYPDRVEKSWLWKSDITDSRVGFAVEDDECVFSGQIDTLRQFRVYANNHCRYTRDCYRYANAEVESLLALLDKYDLFTPYDSFGEYYHNTIVD